MKKTHNQVQTVKSLSSGKPQVRKSKKKKLISVFTIIICIWLIAIAGAAVWFYGKANDYLTHYEEVYRSSMPELAADDIFAHFSSYDVDYIWNNMSETPRISQFETEDSVKQYISNMIDGKEMSYKQAGDYSDAIPSYVVEADGYVVAEFKLCKDLENAREFGFPTWKLQTITYYTEPFETVNITAPVNFSVYVNGILLDDTYVCSEEEKPEDLSYVQDYADMAGKHDFYVADLYLEPEVTITDMFGNEVAVSYDENTDFYSADYTDQHPERAALEEFALTYTETFANVISQDADLSSLVSYFPENSQLYDAISRNTALEYFTAHGAVTFQNEEIKQFTVYSEDVVFIEVYIEQAMNMWSETTVVPTTARLYCVKIDGEWKVVSMRF